jgi:hypothetical protein
MYKRLAVVAMIVFLLAGVVSAIACEMTCIPANRQTACCAHSMARHAGTSITNMHQCSHPQEETSLAVTAVPSLQTYATASIVSALTLLPHIAPIAGVHDASIPSSLKRSSFTPPLRI